MVLDLEGGGNETSSRIRPPGDMNACKAAPSAESGPGAFGVAKAGRVTKAFSALHLDFFARGCRCWSRTIE